MDAKHLQGKPHLSGENAYIAALSTLVLEVKKLTCLIPRAIVSVGALGIHDVAHRLTMQCEGGVAQLQEVRFCLEFLSCWRFGHRLTQPATQLTSKPIP